MNEWLIIDSKGNSIKFDPEKCKDAIRGILDTVGRENVVEYTTKPTLYLQISEVVKNARNHK